MNLDLAKQWVSHWEGTRLKCYRDSLGIATVGVGFNLTAAGARQTIANLGVDYDGLLTGAVGLAPEQVKDLLVGSVDIAASGARLLVPNCGEITEDRQIVLVDLAFNLGQRKLSTFVRTLQCIREQAWESAAAELEASEWFEQVGPGVRQRGGANVAVLRGSTTVRAVLQLPESSSGQLERVEAVACLLQAA